MLTIGLKVFELLRFCLHQRNGLFCLDTYSQCVSSYLNFGLLKAAHSKKLVFPLHSCQTLIKKPLFHCPFPFCIGCCCFFFRGNSLPCFFFKIVSWFDLPWVEHFLCQSERRYHTFKKQSKLFLFLFLCLLFLLY